MNERDISNRQQVAIERDGIIFTFKNPASLAPAAWYPIDIKTQTTFRNALDYMPFDSVSITNNSSADIIFYVNAGYPGDQAQQILVPKLSARTYDLTKLISGIIYNTDSSTTITANQVFVTFIKNAYNVDRLTENLTSRFGILQEGVRFGARKP